MYNNPFLYGGASSLARSGLLRSLRAINWGTFLGNAQKTLGVINQAIPIVYQVRPILGNARTIFKIANGLRSTSNTNTRNEVIDNANNYTEKTTPIYNTENISKPIFFL